MKASKMRFIHLKNPLRKLLYVLLGGGLIYWLYFATDLPSDDKMIAHFYAHRDELEEVVRRYRSLEVPREMSITTTWLKEEGAQELLHKAGIDRIAAGVPLWLPNPYTLETGKKRIAMSQDTRRTYSIFNKYGSLLIKMSPRRQYRSVNWPRAVVVWKEYFHVPENPRIEDGWLLGQFDEKGAPNLRRRVVSSTNHFPLVWGSFGCVLRPIEPHWFLRLCSGR